MQVGASNELPESEELDALFDRFLIRRQVAQVSSAQLGSLARLAAGQLRPAGTEHRCASTVFICPHLALDAQSGLLGGPQFVLLASSCMQRASPFTDSGRV